MVTLRINAERLRADIEALASIGRSPAGGISRTSFGPADALAREWYLARCAEAGLTVDVDGLGNMVVRAPSDTGRPAPVCSGSHIDTVPNGGRLDGALGSLAALEALRRISETGIELAHPVRALVFSDEEGNYGHLLGSAGLRHGYGRKQLEELSGRDGDRLVDALVAAGYDLDEATRTRVEAGSIHAFVELHIEQGPIMEERGTEIGVVTSIVGLAGARVEFIGSADHAGTTPLTRRKDALLAASEFLQLLPGIAHDISEAAVVTCGMISVDPASQNVVPGVAHLTLDFRDPDWDRLQQLAAAFEQAARDVARRRGLHASWRPDSMVEPVPLHPEVRAAIAAAADGLGLSRMDIPSGAGHDSQNMAWLAPTAMIFVPSINGKSHCPEEDTSWHDIENGANALLATLLALATEEAPVTGPPLVAIAG